jgi:hypothetical protein
MAVLSTRRPILTAGNGAGVSRTSRTSYGFTGGYGFTPSGPGTLPGFEFTSNGSGAAGGGGAPSWMCAIIGRSQCSYADLIGAGLGYLLGGAGSGGGGSEPPSGNGSTAGNLGPGSGGAAGCPAGQTGFPPLCFDITPGGATQGGGVVVTQGEAVMGQFGAALQPMVRSQTVARCLRGMVLGVDGLCYNKRDLRKDERKWVPGRKPLLTGGDLNAISRAARAASRVKTTQKRLMKLGLLKRPAPRGGGSRGVITKAEAARALRK